MVAHTLYLVGPQISFVQLLIIAKLKDYLSVGPISLGLLLHQQIFVGLAKVFVCLALLYSRIFSAS